MKSCKSTSYIENNTPEERKANSNYRLQTLINSNNYSLRL